MNTYDIYKKQLTIQGSFINRSPSAMPSRWSPPAK